MAIIKNPRLIPDDNNKGETSMTALQLLKEDQENFTLNIAELHSLKDIAKGAGAFAMREIDPNHVESLVCTNPELWPPIGVTRTNAGYVYYDGQHRLKAATLLKLTTIQATCKTFVNANDLIEAAFRANIRHGLPASQQTRSDYCYWLSITYPDLKQQQIAVRVGVTQSAVSRAIAQRKKQLEEAVQEAQQGKEAGEESDNEFEQWREGVIKRVKTFVKSVGKFSDTVRETDDYTELVRELQFELLQAPEDRQALQFAGQLLLDAASKSKSLRKGKSA
jgi:ParB-like chromosome segregation protein Spo0J